jgi:hypothetical protein
MKERERTGEATGKVVPPLDRKPRVYMHASRYS